MSFVVSELHLLGSGIQLELRTQGGSPGKAWIGDTEVVVIAAGIVEVLEWGVRNQWPMPNQVPGPEQDSCLWKGEINDGLRSPRQSPENHLEGEEKEKVCQRKRERNRLCCCELSKSHSLPQ